LELTGLKADASSDVVFFFSLEDISAVVPLSDRQGFEPDRISV